VTNLRSGITIRNYRKNPSRATNARLATTLWTRLIKRANEKSPAQFVNVGNTEVRAERASFRGVEVPLALK
jgi:hypothetical protein